MEIRSIYFRLQSKALREIYVKMALRASMILKRCATQLLQTSSCGNISASSNFHSSKARLFNRNEKGMYTCTLIPGDGVSTKHYDSNETKHWLQTD